MKLKKGQIVKFTYRGKIKTGKIFGRWAVGEGDGYNIEIGGEYLDVATKNILPQKMTTIKLEATPLRDNRWAVRPEGKLGTCGFHPKPWTVIYVKAKTAKEAIKKAEKMQ